MVTSVILIPEHDNDGIIFPDALLHEFEQRIAAITRGFTRLQHEALGTWFNEDDVRFDDRLRVYLVVFDDLALFPAILDVIRWAREAFRQEARFVYIGGSGIIR